jgi:ribose-phosphate pyrophosphokinase
MANDLKIFGGNGCPKLAGDIAKYLNVPLGLINIGRFPNGEVKVQIGENVRGMDTFIIQSTGTPVNDNWMELLIIIDALRRASARRITAVIPHYSYARQDRKDQPRVPISAKLVANLLEAAGTNRVLTMDLHADQIQGFFDIPLDHLMALPVFLDHIRQMKLKDFVVGSPDVGGIKAAWYFAERLKVPLVIVDKRRKGPSETRVMNVIGDVKGKSVLMPDDLIQAGSTLAQAARAFKDRGAEDIYAFVTHPLFSEGADTCLPKSGIKEIFVTDSVPLNDIGKALKEPHVTALSVARLFGEAIHRTHEETSISTLLH